MLGEVPGRACHHHGAITVAVKASAVNLSARTEKRSVAATTQDLLTLQNVGPTGSQSEMPDLCVRCVTTAAARFKCTVGLLH